MQTGDVKLDGHSKSQPEAGRVPVKSVTVTCVEDDVGNARIVVGLELGLARYQPWTMSLGTRLASQNSTFFSSFEFSSLDEAHRTVTGHQAGVETSTCSCSARALAKRLGEMACGPRPNAQRSNDQFPTACLIRHNNIEMEVAI